MIEEKFLSGENGGKTIDKKIASEREDILGQSDTKETIQSLVDRISQSTKIGGLTNLPSGFDNQDGDWQCINSSNPFEILYLDYKQYKFITPETVKKNYLILESFWKDKVTMMNTGGNRIAFKKKYGEGTIESSLITIKKAFEKLSTEKGIEEYYIEINNQRLRKGEDGLKESIEDMLVDGSVEKAEIELRLARGLKYDLSEEEVIDIINIAIVKHKLKPYGEIKGNTEKERLLSVPWMTDSKIEEQKKIEEEKRKRGREIFDNVYAYSIEEIGEILFNNEGLAKEYIRDGLIINSIDYFSSSKAKNIVEINKNQKNEHLKYLQIIYRLNPNLPYKFTNINYSNIRALSQALFENSKIGKEDLKQGNIEIWLLETQKDSYEKLKKIRDTADNVNLAFLEMIYSFNPELPYRFSGNQLIKTPLELCSVIDQSKENWSAGKDELYDSSILIWLKTIGYSNIVNAWENIKGKVNERKDYGLELFLYLLNNKLTRPKLNINIKEISLPNIHSVTNVTTSFTLTNDTRGYLEGDLSLSKLIQGVSLSSKLLSINNVNGISSYKYSLVIDPTDLLKGVEYKTTLQIRSTSDETINIPVSFKLVFPKRAFIKEIVKYAALLGIMGGLIRGGIALLGFNDWLVKSYPYYLSPGDIAWQKKPEIYLFSLIFSVLVIFIWVVIKFRKKIFSGLDKI